MSLGKILSSSVKTNTQKGNPRFGEGYIDATDVLGNKVHRYNLEGRADIAFAPKSMTTYGNRPMGAPAAKGGLVNQIKGSVRYGKTYTETTRGGIKGHLYGSTFVPMGKAKK